MVPSNLENKKKRVFVKNIEDTKGHKQFSDYAEEWDYLTNSGITMSVKAISNLHFALSESEQKNLLKLYLNDVGLLTAILYDTNIMRSYKMKTASTWVLSMNPSCTRAARPRF